MKYLLIIIASFFLIPQVYASPKITIHGTLKGYNSKTVQIQTKEAVVTVPRSSLKVPLKGLAVGLATVQAKVSIADMIKYNGKPGKKDKK